MISTNLLGLKNLALACGDAVVGPCTTSLPSVTPTSSTLDTVLKFVFGLIAIIATIFVVIGGIQFMTANGNSESVNKAKNTLLYAIIGLVISLSAQLLVTFVLQNIMKI